jgi:hypothetical protein
MANRYFILYKGEEPLSYGYGGTGKASTDCKFKDYGKPFHVGDVVGALLVSMLELSFNQRITVQDTCSVLFYLLD